MARSRQRGVSILGWMVIIAVIGSIATLAIRITPHYVDFYAMQNFIEALPASEVHTMDKVSIRDNLHKRFLVNNIRDLNARDVIQIERKRDSTDLVINYERREHLVYNADLVLTFNRRYEFK